MIIEIDFDEIKDYVLIYSERDGVSTYHIDSNDKEFRKYLKFLEYIIDKKDLNDDRNNYHYRFEIYDNNSYFDFYDIDPTKFVEFFNTDNIFFIFDFPDEETAFYFKLKFC